MPRLLTLALLLLALAALPLHAAEVSAQLDFADALYAEGDHYRAITEYKRFIHQNPQMPACAHARLRIARSYLAGERWSEAEKQLQRLQENWPTSPEALRGALLYAEIPFRRGQYAHARQRYRLAGKQHPEQLLPSRYRVAWTYIEQGEYPAAHEELVSLQQPQASELAADLEQLQQLEEKSPGLAGGLSALLPGAGQLYVGRSRDAGISFALNAAFILATLEAFDNDNEFLGGILLFFELGWYSGNIYNAVNGAHHSNREQRENLLQQLRDQHGFDLRLTPDAAMLQWRGQF